MFKIYLKSLTACLSEFLDNRSSLSNEQKFFKETPDLNEPMARFIYQSNHFKPKSSRVTYHAFMPILNEKLNRYETSVFRVVNLTMEGRLKLEKQHGRKDKVLKAIALNQVRNVIECDLEISPDDYPKRHTNIIGWPANLNDKSDRIALATKLANACSLELVE